MTEQTVHNFKYSTQVVLTKRYKIIEIAKNLDKFTLEDLKLLDKLGFFTYYGQIDDDFLSQYLFIEDSLCNESLNHLKKSISGLYPKILGSESGSNIYKLQTAIQQNIKEHLTEDIKENQLYKITKGDYSNLVVKLLKYDPEVSLCEAFVFNKEVQLKIPTSYLERSTTDLEIYNFSKCFVRTNYLENSSKYLIIDCNYLILWSTINNPTLYSKEFNKYVGSSFGFYFTILKLKQLYPDYNFVYVYGAFEENDYNYQLQCVSILTTADTHSLNVSNRQWSKEFIQSIGGLIIDNPSIRTNALVKSIIDNNEYTEAIIYSRDKSYYSIMSNKISMYLNKISTNGYDEIFTYQDLLNEIPFNNVDDIIKLIAFYNTGVFTLIELPHTLYQYVIQLYKRLKNLNLIIEYLQSNFQYREFILKYYHDNVRTLSIDKYSPIKLSTIKTTSPNKDEIVKVLNRNSFYKESSIIESIYPILVSII